VPIFWEQKGITENVLLTRGPELTKKAFHKHASDIVSTYGPCHIINLLRYKKRREALLTREYVRQCYESELKDKLTTTNFDFHGYCGGERYQALKVLVN